MRWPKTILLAEDDDDVYEIFSEFLASLGYAVEGASDGVEALRRATRLKPSLVILDVILPGLNGFEVAERLRSDPDTAQIPILALTGLVRDDIAFRVEAAGCDALVLKPCSLDRLADVVRGLTRESSAPAH